jgi:hypothetical protein
MIDVAGFRVMIIRARQVTTAEVFRQAFEPQASPVIQNPDAIVQQRRDLAPLRAPDRRREQDRDADGSVRRRPRLPPPDLPSRRGRRSRALRPAAAAAASGLRLEVPSSRSRLLPASSGSGIAFGWTAPTSAFGSVVRNAYLRLSPTMKSLTEMQNCISGPASKC